MNNQPADPVSPLEQLAAAHHEMWTAYVRAGFTTDQALYLVGQIVRAGATASASPQS